MISKSEVQILKQRLMKSDAKNHTIFTTLGASNHSNSERQEQDYYATDPLAAHLLLELESFTQILEPACGEGHLSRVFEDYGFELRSSDLIDRGYGKQKDFFDYKSWSGDIITNPPYKYAQDFVEHALNIVPLGSKVAMFLKLSFLEGVKRKKLFQNHPPKTVYVSSSRINCVKNGEFEAYPKSAIAYAWYIWEKGYSGKTIIEWFN